MPAAMEIFGNSAAPLLELIKTLSKRASEISYIPQAILHSYWLKRFSTVIQTGNARLLLDSATRMSCNIQANASTQPDAEVLLQDIHIAPQNTFAFNA